MAETMHRNETLLQRVRHIQDVLRTSGITPVDMRRAGTLETDVLLPQAPGELQMDAPSISLLEGEISHRAIPKKNETQLRWFIDGRQKTMPVWRFGVVPIVVGIAVAGIVERTPDGVCHLVPGSMFESINWIVPHQTGDPDIRRFVDILEELGQKTHDPLDSKPNYQQLAGMYDQVLFHANEKANDLRKLNERQALEFWRTNVTAYAKDKWLMVDGRLEQDLPNAIGFIKDPGRQHLVGQDAVTLLSLPPGHRTSAYHLTEGRGTRTHWYQRMWPADGLDARHALIRVEASQDVVDPEEIDTIASWLIAERVPRPTADSRWPTLLYPVHMLERILKRRIDQITTGWPV